ncbi:hypothetical protein, partial [Flavobacterium aurantiibacter]
AIPTYKIPRNKFYGKTVIFRDFEIERLKDLGSTKFHKVLHDVRNAAFDKLPSTGPGTDVMWFSWLQRHVKW